MRVAEVTERGLTGGSALSGRKGLTGFVTDCGCRDKAEGIEQARRPLLQVLVIVGESLWDRI